MSIRALVSGSIGMLATASVSAGGGCPGLVFSDASSRIDLPGTVGPTSVGIGDLTGDGIVDLLLSDSFESGPGPDPLLLRPGLGGGHFGDSVPIESPIGPDMITLADLDEDGDLDIIINGNAGLATLINTGNAQFITGQVWIYNNGFGEVKIADMDGDGLGDIVAVGAYVEGVNVFRGSGGGVFLDPLFSGAYPQTSGFDIGDFNEDGIPDLCLSQYFRGRVSIMLGDGAGRFTESFALDAPHYTPAVRAADLDKDGHLDFVAAHSFGDVVSVCYGDGSGGVEQIDYVESPPAAFSYPQAIDVADLDGDGHLDIVTAASETGPTVLLGLGERVFGSPRLYGANSEIGTSSIYAVDVSGDGIADVVASDTAAGTGVNIVINACDAMCSGADMARPYGDQDLGDINTFVAYFTASNPIADLNRDESLDLADIVFFVSQFNNDCPGGD